MFFNRLGGKKREKSGEVQSLNVTMNFNDSSDDSPCQLELNNTSLDNQNISSILNQND